jgi:hypothetical protein
MNPVQTIPNLPLAITLSGDELLWLNQANNDVRATVRQIFFLLSGSSSFAIGGPLVLPSGPAQLSVYSATQNAMLEVVGDGHASQIIATRYSNDFAEADIIARKARGTMYAPLQNALGDYPGMFITQGFDGSAWRTASNIMTRISSYNGPNDFGTELLFNVRSDGVNALGQVLKIDKNGVVSVSAGIPIVDQNANFTGGTLALGGPNGAAYGALQPGDLFSAYSATNPVVLSLYGDGVTPSLRANSFGTGIAPFLAFQAARGTMAAKTHVASGDSAGSVAWSPFDGVQYRTAAQITGVIDTWTAPANFSGYLAFYTRPDGLGAALTERARIDKVGLLRVNQNSNPSPIAPVAGTVIQGVAANGVQALIALDTYGNATGSRLFLRSAGNNAGNPSPPTQGNNLGAVVGAGYDASAAVFRGAANITFNAAANWSVGNTPGEIAFWATPVGAIAQSQYYVITSGGSLVPVGGPLSIAATEGFIGLPTCPGQPTGAPSIGYSGSNQTNFAPTVYDTVGHKVWFYDYGLAAWQSSAGANPIGGAGGDLGGAYPNPLVAKVTNASSIAVGAPLAAGSQLSVYSNSALAEAAIVGDNQYSALIVKSYGAGLNASAYLLHARGSAAAPLAPANGDYIGAYAFAIYDGSGNPMVSGMQSFVDTYVAPGNNSSYLTFHTRPDGAGAALAERMRIDKNGNVGIGKAPTAVAGFIDKASIYNNTNYSSLNIIGDGQGCGLSLSVFSNANVANMVFQSARGSLAAPLALGNGNLAGSVEYDAWDGSAYQPIAYVRAFTDTVTGANNISGFLSFLTRSDGAGVSAGERMRIDKNGAVTITGQMTINDPNITTDLSVLTLTCGNVNGGVGLHMVGNGSTTPGKWIRVVNGQLQVVNDAYNAVLLTLTDAGGAAFTGTVLATGAFYANGVPGTNRGINFNTNNAQRWVFYADSAAEGGSNAGSNLQLARYNDAGVFIDSPISIVRSTGTVTFSQVPFATTYGINSGAGTNRATNYYTNSVARWLVGCNGQAEAGLSVGSDFAWYNYDDTGAALGVPLIITRSTGVAHFSQPIVNGSDKRNKTDLKPVTKALETISKLQGLSYKHKGLKQRQFGLVAQDVAKVLPDIVFEGTDEEKTLGIAYTNLIAVLIEALKELTARVKTLEAA